MDTKGWTVPALASGSVLRGLVRVPPVKPRRSVDPVSAYAWDVLQGRVVACRLVILACERHWRDLMTGEKRGLSFRPDKAQFALGFFGKFLRHSKGEWAGKPMILEPWQEFALGSVFGWMRKDKTRRFRTAYNEIARKQGKSQVAAGVGLYGLIGEREPGAEIYCAATRKDQARIIFEEAQRMVRASPYLLSALRVFRLNISNDKVASKMEPLSADERTLDGLNPSMVLIDELHKHRNRAVLDVLDTALGARRQPLIWMITTAGDDNPESVYAAENAYSIQVLEGTVEDDSYFALIYTLDKGDRWDDQSCWIKANPNLGVSVKLDDMRRQALKAARSPPARNAFMRLRLNVRTASTERAIDMDVWSSNSDGPFDPAELQGRLFYGALDVSAKIDLTAWVKLFPPLEGETRWKVVPRFWMPSDTVEAKSDRDRVQYQRWIEAGYIEVTQGNVVDQNEIQHAIIEDCRLHEALSVAYDPWNATQLAVNLADAGVPVVEFIQGIRSYTAPTKEMMAWLLEGKLDHGGNPVLAWMAGNMHTSLPDKNDNVMPSKKHSVSRIDGMTGLIMCIGRSMVEDTRSYLETGDPITF